MPFHVKFKLGRVGLEAASIGSLQPPAATVLRVRWIVSSRDRTINGVALDKDTYPDIALSDLADDRFEAFFAIKDEVVKQVRRASL